MVIRVGALITACLAVYLLWFEHYPSVDYMVPRVPDFFIGLIAGQLASGRPIQFRPGMMLALAFVVLIYISTLHRIDGGDVLLGAAYLCIFLCLEAALGKSGMGRKVLGVLGFVGTYSYELYLLHQPLMRTYSRMVMVREFEITEPTKAQLFIGMIVGLVVAGFGAIILHRLTNIIPKWLWNRGRIHPDATANP
jgi:peptidoglycan/LPS O-acetylase OafA/YrhL